MFAFLLRQTDDHSVDAAPFVVTENMDRNAAIMLSFVGNQHETPSENHLSAIEDALLF